MSDLVLVLSRRSDMRLYILFRSSYCLCVSLRKTDFTHVVFHGRVTNSYFICVLFYFFWVLALFLSYVQCKDILRLIYSFCTLLCCGSCYTLCRVSFAGFTCSRRGNLLSSVCCWLWITLLCKLIVYLWYTFLFCKQYLVSCSASNMLVTCCLLPCPL